MRVKILPVQSDVTELNGLLWRSFAKVSGINSRIFYVIVPRKLWSNNKKKEGEHGDNKGQEKAKKNSNLLMI